MRNIHACISHQFTFLKVKIRVWLELGFGLVLEKGFNLGLDLDQN